MDVNGDPGWRSAIVAALASLIPGLGGRFRRRRMSASNGLTMLRTVYLSFVFAIALIGVVVAVFEGTADDLGSASEMAAAVVVLAVGTATLAGSRLIIRPLPCDTEATPAAGYRSPFFLRVALAEAAAIVAFLAFVVSGAGWLYPLGASFTAIGFARLAPTARHLEEDEEELRHRGCGISLVWALQHLPRPS